MALQKNASGDEPQQNNAKHDKAHQKRVLDDSEDNEKRVLDDSEDHGNDSDHQEKRTFRMAKTAMTVTTRTTTKLKVPMKMTNMKMRMKMRMIKCYQKNYGKM
jgi:hypothetical protein